MRILVTGGSGLLGAEVCARGIQEGHDIYAGFRSNPPADGKPTRLDLSKPDVGRVVRDVNPDLVIHTGGLADVDQCEEQPEFADRVNGIASGDIAKVALSLGAHLTYVSTDYIFDGAQGNYDENASPNPISQYGRSKMVGERLVAKTGSEYCIARTSLIYGWRRAWKLNYAASVVHALEGKREIKAANDLYSSPTLSTNLAEMLLELGTRRLTGIFHVSGATRTNRLEFANAIATQFSLNPAGIVRVNAQMLNLKAIRPPDSSLNVSKATRTLDTKPLELPEALQLFQRTRPIKC